MIGMLGNTCPEASCAECSVGFAARELRRRSAGAKQDFTCRLMANLMTSPAEESPNAFRGQMQRTECCYTRLNSTVSRGRSSLLSKTAKSLANSPQTHSILPFFFRRRVRLFSAGEALVRQSRPAEYLRQEPRRVQLGARAGRAQAFPSRFVRYCPGCSLARAGGSRVRCPLTTGLGEPRWLATNV